MLLTKARAALQAHKSEVAEYEAEVIKVIRGESKLSSELLNKLHEEAKAEQAAEAVYQMERKLKNSEEMRYTLIKQYDTVSGWVGLYDNCDLSAKKMIVSRLMKEVRVKRDYEIDIDLTVDCASLGIQAFQSATLKESA